jgi:hypothetical protein
MREGDQIGFRLTADDIIGEGHDLMIGVEIQQKHSSAAGASTEESHGKFRGITRLNSVLSLYDACFLIKRDYLADALGLTSWDAEESYFGYLNEVLTTALLSKSGGIKFTEQIAIFPGERNIELHNGSSGRARIERVLSRRRFAASKVEEGADAILNSILLNIHKHTKFGEPLSSELDPLKNNYLPQSAAVDAHIEALRNCLPRSEGANTIAPEWRSGNPSEIDCGERLNPLVSIISSAFKGHELVYGFMANLLALASFDDFELILVLPEGDIIQDLVCEYFSSASKNIILMQLGTDPGIYGCWNLAIEAAKGKYITNANIDDRRDSSQVLRLIKEMERTHALVGSAAVVVTTEIQDIKRFSGDIATYINSNDRDVWFSYDNPENRIMTLRDFFKYNSSGELEQCFNFPHCMPVWRKELHDDFGFFDEGANGTYADFALWLRVASTGAVFSHLNDPLGLYYIDPNSHNRRRSNEMQWRSVVEPYLPFGTLVKAPVHVKNAEDTCLNLEERDIQEVPKFDFGSQISQEFGRHRSGWAYALSAFEPIHDPTAATYCDTFIEKRFVWGSDLGDGGCGPVTPHHTPWIGFIHVPPLVPFWFQYEQSNSQIFSTKAWQQSMATCRGIFTMSDYHRKSIESILNPRFPISVLRHPTEFPSLKFTIEKYRSNPKKRLIQIGWWLRKLNAIHRLRLHGLTPTLLGKSDWSKSIITYAERRYYSLGNIAGAETLDFVDNDRYDELLSENIVFIDFYDTSANNAVIECIARSTPIAVCRHPAVEEYLGVDYPLFYSCYADLNGMLNDEGRLAVTSEYLRQPEIKDALKLEVFRNEFLNSEVVRNAHI